ncbi:MAG: TIR domain-containing protein [Planctomycetota bacterium]
MVQHSKSYDLFFSYSVDLANEVKSLKKKFTDAGFTVFEPSEIQPGQDLIKETWDALAGSWAVVVLIRPGRIPSTVAVEIGAASAWQKPTYILTTGKGEYHVPFYFSQYQVFDLSDVDKLIERIRDDRSPLTEEQINALKNAYQRLGIPTDKLLMQPASIERLNKMLQEDIGLQVSGERIMQLLLRLRKQGVLTRIRRKKHS